ncbi:MAG: hypothetical protein A3F68_08815 [Acidobacteria bacterium RIFCSPLOWO2_12_FULL_54_10]|nr:MAG: hypothetical protein A3F68_08815 [Acidobacteria bacterium RIFCSPLOWO2_12_FULL_54_10]
MVSSALSIQIIDLGGETGNWDSTLVFGVFCLSPLKQGWRDSPGKPDTATLLGLMQPAGLKQPAE